MAHSSDDWPIEDVMLCLENQGISVGLTLRSVHRYNPRGEVSERDLAFIERNYSRILRHLIKQARERKAD
jgi:hypothetical protein